MKTTLSIVLLILVNISFCQTEKCLKIWPQPNCEDLKPFGREVYNIHDGVDGEECMLYVDYLKGYTGIAYQCWDNGKVKYLEFYVDGKLNGVSRLYESKGFIDEYYKNDKLKWTKCYDENAKEIECPDWVKR